MSDNKKTLTSVSVSINDGPTKTAIVDIQAPEKDDPQHKYWTDNEFKLVLERKSASKPKQNAKAEVAAIVGRLPSAALTDQIVKLHKATGTANVNAVDGESEEEREKKMRQSVDNVTVLRFPLPITAAAADGQEEEDEWKRHLMPFKGIADDTIFSVQVLARPKATAAAGAGDSKSAASADEDDTTLLRAKLVQLATDLCRDLSTPDLQHAIRILQQVALDGWQPIQVDRGGAELDSGQLRRQKSVAPGTVCQFSLRAIRDTIRDPEGAIASVGGSNVKLQRLSTWSVRFGADARRVVYVEVATVKGSVLG